MQACGHPISFQPRHVIRAYLCSRSCLKGLAARAGSDYEATRTRAIPSGEGGGGRAARGGTLSDQHERCRCPAVSDHPICVRGPDMEARPYGLQPVPSYTHGNRRALHVRSKKD